MVGPRKRGAAGRSAAREPRALRRSREVPGRTAKSRLRAGGTPSLLLGDSAASSSGNVGPVRKACASGPFPVGAGPSTLARRLPSASRSLSAEMEEDLGRALPGQPPRRSAPRVL